MYGYQYSTECNYHAIGKYFTTLNYINIFSIIQSGARIYNYINKAF